ncbi:LOW QUALITY PROTEIN: hypothetical protein ACHAXT_003419 [Thalassiosira profunda]
MDKIGTMMDGDANDGAGMEAPPPLGADAANASATAAVGPSGPPPPSRPPLVRRTSTDGSGEKATTAPAPPRWRFVKEAKKSMGYSSLHAGSYIRGRSSEELGAKYTAPDIALYKPKKEVAEVEVGKLGSRGEHTETEEYAGWAPGLARNDPNATGPRGPYKEWDANMTLSSNAGREHEWHDGQYHPSYSGDVETHTPYVPPVESTPPGEEATHSSPTCVGRLQFQGVPESEDVFVGEFRRHKKALQSVGMDDNEGNGLGHVIDGVEETIDKGRDGDEENLFQDEDAFHEDGGASRDEAASSTQESKEEDGRKKRRYCCFLLPLLLLLLAAILGPILGRKKKGGDDPAEGVPATTGVVVPPPIIVFVDNETAVPSSAPSSVCPLGFTPFVVDSAPPLSASNVTWRIADACSGEVVARCLPCPVEGTSLFETRAIEPSNDFLGGRGTLECLPTNAEYGLEVVWVEDSSEECCGFDADSIISFDGVPVAMNDGEGLFGDASSGTTYFGERDEPCPSASPSVVASAPPSFEPSSVPSYAPTRAPTRSPVVFMGPCVPYFQSGADYGVGAQVTADNLVYECTKDSCVSFWFGIGELADALLTQGEHLSAVFTLLLIRLAALTSNQSLFVALRMDPDWILFGNEAAIQQPHVIAIDWSHRISFAVTVAPANSSANNNANTTADASETSAPTCAGPDFDLCVAIDMSGSVCDASTIECRDFRTMLSFAFGMVAGLDDLEGESSFSIVTFASEARLVTGLSSAEEAASIITELKFRGGDTHTAGAINECQKSLLASTTGRQRFILMITDGEPTEPGTWQEATALAEQAADSAKEDGTTIIPIFIAKADDSEENKGGFGTHGTAPDERQGNEEEDEALAFMEQISSDGKVFDVSGFDALYGLQDLLLDEVAQPTDRPTSAPTCSEPEFDVCFAIDMSGSVCPGDDNGCKDFESMQEFAVEMVAEMDLLPGDSSFSVVEFASDSDLVSGLSSAAVTAVEIDGLKFSAGATNTAGAINDCHSSLRAATLQRKKFIMMITDGQPTEPGDEDKATKAAEDAATSAKAEGSIIIPIFISKLKDFAKEKEALEFMERISSDGTFFDVTGFDSLITLQDVLLSEVANCGRASLDELNIGELVDELEEEGGNKF